MKIAFFMESYYCGGVDTFVINLINNWPNHSDELILICNKNHFGLPVIREKIKRPCRIIENKVIIFTGLFNKIRKMKLFDYISIFILKLLSPIIRYLFLIYNTVALRKVFLQNNADRLMVINGGYPGGDSCRAASISWGLFIKKPKSIHNFHGVVVKPKWHITPQEVIVDILVSHFTKTFVTVSLATTRLMRRRKVFSKRNEITYIYSGIENLKNNHDANLMDLRKELGIPAESQLCLMLGNYNYNKNFNKGHNFLFRAFKKVISQIPNAHLLICGHGSFEDIEKIRWLASKFNIEKNTHLFGFRDDVSSLLNCTQVLLVSAQVFESFGFASVEAMAHCVPVVATRVGAIPEIIIDGQGGYCVDKGDIDSYSKHIIKLLSNEYLRREQGQKGFQRYRDFFTASRMAEEYSRLIYYG